MPGKSDYLEAGLLNVLRGTAFPLSNTGSVYISLHTADPTDAGGAGEVGAGVGYTRQAVTKAAGSWAAPSGSPSAITNAALITFGPATGSWATVTHVGIWDAVSAGNLLYSGSLSASKAIATDDSAQFAIGALSISEE